MYNKTLAYTSILVCFIILCCCVFRPFPGVSSATVDVSADPERLRIGKEKYEAIQRETKIPRYSQCWTAALRNLELGCKRLTDDVQHRLALDFANCYLEKTGRDMYPCEAHRDVTECISAMPETAYLVYTEFFTQTQNICFFLQAQVWQEETEFTISRLADTSNVVAQQLENSSTIQLDLLAKQNESIKNQETMMKSSIELKKTLEESSVDIHRMLQDFRDATMEQKTMIFEVFDRVNSLQSMVMGEFTGFYSIIFYAMSILICYLLTSTARTGGARFYLFALMTVSIITERLIVAFGQDDVHLDDGTIIDGASEVYRRLWTVRKMSSIGALLVWFYSAYKYQDINKINNILLEDIRKQNQELKTMLQTSVMGSSSMAVTHVKANLVPTEKPVPAWHQFFSSKDPDHTDLGFPAAGLSGYEEDSDEESTDSLDSGVTDHTFQADDLQDEESDASFATVDSGRFSSETPPAMLDELRFLRESTPMREIQHELSFVNTNESLEQSSLNSSAPRKRGRPKGSTNKAKEKGSANTTPQSHYNLRRRSSSLTPNPSVAAETPETFGRYVKHLADVAIRNRRKVQYTVKHIHRGHANDTDDDH